MWYWEELKNTQGVYQTGSGLIKMDAIHDNDPVSNRRPQSCWQQDCGSECFVTFNIFAELIEMMVSSNWIVIYANKVMLLFPGYRQWADWLALSSACILWLLSFWEDPTHKEMVPGVMENHYIWIQVNVKEKTWNCLLGILDISQDQWKQTQTYFILI